MIEERKNRAVWDGTMPAYRSNNGYVHLSDTSQVHVLLLTRPLLGEMTSPLYYAMLRDQTSGPTVMKCVARSPCAAAHLNVIL